MAVLHRLALAGNMRELRERADRLVSLHDDYRPFASRLRALADRYQSKAILTFVESYLARE